MKKVCKKHGQLAPEHIRMSKTKKGTTTLVCRLCKRLNREAWRKNNPGKVTLGQQKRRERRLQELKEGKLKKQCKRHGNVPVADIRIDVRGTRVCKICDRENINKLRNKDPDLTREKQRKWIEKNPEKRKLYLKRDREKKRQRRLSDPVYREKIRERARGYLRKQVKQLDDKYIKGQLKNVRVGGKRRYISGVVVPPELIELKRLQLLLHREIRKRKIENDN